MVSADNLNLDVLELIFANLGDSGKDLASVALVSRSFFAAVIPRLYCNLVFGLSQSKRYPTLMAASSAIIANPELAIHVRHIEIRNVPKLKDAHHPVFLRHCSRAIRLCSNLTTFVCEENSLPPLIPSLQDKSRLRALRIHANLTTDQAEKLINMNTRLTSLALNFASWNVMDVLPKWTQSLRNTLTTLTLFMVADLNEGVLENALTHLPGLLGLNVIGCPKIDHTMVLRLTERTPLLENLSLTTLDTNRALPVPAPPLIHLRHLAIDIRHTLLPTPNPLLSSILTHLRDASSPPLSSFALKLSDRQNPVDIVFITQLLDLHATSLRDISFMNSPITRDSIANICRKCSHLERLQFVLPVKEVLSFSSGLARSSSLKTIVDMSSHNVTHGPRAALNLDNIRHIMGCVPSLQRIESDNESRIWTCQRSPNHIPAVALERRKGKPPPMDHWFMAPRLDD